MKPLERFEEKVDKQEDGCWIWEGAKNNKGYGIFSYKGKTILAHRMSWLLHNGEIPKEQNVLHKCDVRACVNPEHLFLGSLKDNMQDCSKKGRLHVNFPGYSGEKHGNAKLKNSDVIEIRERRKNGERACLLAKEYGVHRQTISDISRGIYWKNLMIERGN
jgi:hypothetical protein